MNPPPPMPQLNGSVTPSVAAAATAASIALPPWSRIAIAARLAGAPGGATEAPVPRVDRGPPRNGALRRLAALVQDADRGAARRVAGRCNRAARPAHRRHACAGYAGQ